MKKKLIGLFIVFLIGFSWFIYCGLQPNAWVGESEDGKWKVIYEQEGIKERWFGTLQWKAEGEPIITYREFKINGVHSTGDGGPGAVKQSRSERVEGDIEFAAFGEQPGDKDTLELILLWIEGETEFEEVIILRP
ncbi:hypothetical protein MM300_20630 [Evansella sp. LMS18]|uniref:hypothetical protein n=1 Tax=Evansella sp. LMS18 TaxID=2924033 RepID=UPI0020D1EA73|nr:hypothetical protein [Evansella sp. LMS18]UTR10252.1 hypothetical protein MM300_20630 [Evansella sp. LMS18]